MRSHWSMSWAAFAEQSHEVDRATISANSRKTYERTIRAYNAACVTMEIAEADRYPLTEDSIRGFLMFSFRQRGLLYNSLHNYIAGFAFYFKENGLPDLTKSISFKNFKAGLRRMMLGDSPPNRKDPLLPEHLQQMLDAAPPTKPSHMETWFLITLSFFGFLRISEALSLLVGDITISENLIVLNIKKSKNDQTGAGWKVTLPDNKKPYHPLRFAGWVNQTHPGARLFMRSASAYSGRLKGLLKVIKLDTKRYSFHSLRRGAAHHASKCGIQDAVIKSHGRWRSEAYMVYVAVDAERAGAEISAIL